MLNNFEYTFFDQDIANKFSQFIKAKGFNTETRQENAPSYCQIWCMPLKN